MVKEDQAMLSNAANGSKEHSTADKQSTEMSRLCENKKIY